MTTLRDYQIEAAAQGYHVLEAFDGFYVQHPPGAGKTLTSIAIARLLKVHRVAVACPPVALGVWAREIRKWWPGARVRDERPNVVQWAPPAVEIRAVSYDSLSDPTPAVGRPRKTGRNRLKDLCEWEPELLILDEAQYVKSPSSKRTKAIWTLRKASKYVVLLSGTPSHNDLDLWSQYRMIAPDEWLWSMSFTDYKTTIYQCNPYGGYPLKDKQGNLRYKPGAKDRIYEATCTYTHVIDVDKMELPEPVENVVPFELEDTEWNAYQDMETTLRAELPDGSETEAELVLTKMLRLSQITAGHAKNTDGVTVSLGTSRLRTVLGLLEEREDQKVVIACRFKEDIARLIVELNKQGRPLARIDGSTPPAFRTKYEDWFQSEACPRNAVMLLQYQAGGVAITLHASHTLILYTLDLSVIRFRQMIGRIWRLGQKGLCEIVIPVAEGTQDEVALAGLKFGDDNRLSKMLLDRLHGR